LIQFLLPIHQALALTISDFTPVSHWTCDEVSGIRYDSNILNSNDLTDNNTVTSATGLLNNACDFERTDNEYLNNNSPSNFVAGNSARSINLWANFESNSGSAQIPFDYGVDTTGNELAFYYEATKLGVDKYGAAAEVSWTPTVSTWYMLTLVVDGSNHLLFYVNGTQQGTTQTLTLNTTATDMSVGRRGAGSLNQGYMDGLLDEITYFDYALDTSEITSLYNAGTPLAYDTGSDPGTGSSTATSTASLDDSNILFMLGFIVFLITLMVLGLFFSTVRKK